MYTRMWINDKRSKSRLLKKKFGVFWTSEINQKILDSFLKTDEINYVSTSVMYINFLLTFHHFPNPMEYGQSTASGFVHLRV